MNERPRRCARCDAPVADGDGVAVPGLDASGAAHRACVPEEYRDFMQLIERSFPPPQPVERGPERSDPDR